MALENNDVDVSVIIPVYNCNEWIVSNLNKIYNYFNKLENNWELIVVDDGSTDHTKDVLAELRKKYSQVRSIIFRRNRKDN